MAFQKLASTDELPPGALIEVVRGKDLFALCNVGGDIRALAGVCPHHGGPLGQGALAEGLVSCPWHAWPFDTATGACTFNEAVRIPTYPVRIEGMDVLVDVPESNA
jgi:nitrite reductase/ring-hydroxylating ferredoxin subunit